MELNRIAFRRLVQLYLLLSVVTMIGAFVEAESSRWTPFALEFDRLSERYFGSFEDLGEPAVYAVALLCLVTIIGHIVGTIGLLAFRAWARILFVITMTLNIAYAFVPGFFPYWSSFLGMLLFFVDAMLFGMIIILAFSADHGRLWFAKTSPTPEPTPDAPAL